MSVLIFIVGIIWCICLIKFNRYKDGFYRFRQYYDEYEDEIRMMLIGFKKFFLSYEFQDETDIEEEILYFSKY